ncbi:MAG: hypothetical protein U0804_24040 [Gemmataceae bacterium]
MTRLRLLALPAAALAVAALLAGCGTKHDGTKHDGPEPTAHQGHGSDPHAGHGGGQKAASLVVKTDPAQIAAGQPTTLKLMIHDAGGAMVKDFDVTHEAKFHLVVVRDGLDTFAHLHPAVDPAGNLTTTYTFPTAGTYRLYADHQPTGGKAGTAVAEVTVAGQPPPAPPLTPNVPAAVEADGLAARVTVGNAKAGGEGVVRFELLDAGQPLAGLQPYMGAMGHLVVLSGDGKEYVHAHPADDKTPANVVAFAAHFPRAGVYKGWGQFRWKDAVRVVPFVVRVD